MCEICVKHPQGIIAQHYQTDKNLKDHKGKARQKLKTLSVRYIMPVYSHIIITARKY